MTCLVANMSLYCHAHNWFPTPLASQNTWSLHTTWRYSDVIAVLYLLNRAMVEGMCRNCEPDVIVSSLSQSITNRANSYFEKHSSERSDSYFHHEKKTEKRKRYTDECKLLKFAAQDICVMCVEAN